MLTLAESKKVVSMKRFLIFLFLFPAVATVSTVVYAIIESIAKSAALIST
jgi:hypothetical protein